MRRRRPGPSPPPTFEGGDHLVRERFVEVVGDPELALEQAQPAFPSRPRERPEPGYRPAFAITNSWPACARSKSREKCVFASCTLTVSMVDFLVVEPGRVRVYQGEESGDK
jgi:hypothetical protein